MDVAVICKARRREELAALKASLENQCSDRTVTWSVYSTRTIEHMASDGSLFLWHLRLEGQLLWERDEWWTILSPQITDYAAPKAARDIDTFLTVLEDCENALGLGDSTLLFEAATIFAALRGIGMIQAMLNGEPCFSRSAAQLAIGPTSTVFALGPADLLTLQQAKLIYSRKQRGQVDGLDRDWCRKTVRAARRVAVRAREALVSVS